MITKDLEWLAALEKKVWRAHASTTTQGKPRTHYDEARSLTAAELKKVKELFKQYKDELIFEPGSGVFGFGVSIAVYLPPSYPGLPCEYLLCLTGKHVNKDDNAYNRKIAYDFVESYTHTTRNKELRKMYGFQKELQPMAYYDY